MPASEPNASEPEAKESDQGIDDLAPVDAIKALIAEAQAAAASESALLRACGVIVATSLKSMSIWGIAALFCAFVGLLAFAIGALIAVAGWTGPVLAMLIVPGALFLIAAIGVLRVRGQLRVMRDAVDVLRQ
jgi:hypothetical protein